MQPSHKILFSKNLTHHKLLNGSVGQYTIVFNKLTFKHLLNLDVVTTRFLGCNEKGEQSHQFSTKHFNAKKCTNIFTKKHVKAGQSALLKRSNSMPETYAEARHHQSSAPPQTLPVTFNSSPTSVKCIDHAPQMAPETHPYTTSPCIADITDVNILFITSLVGNSITTCELFQVHLGIQIFS